MRTPTRTRGLLAAALVLPTVVVSGVVTSGVAAAATGPCEAMTTPVLHVVNPGTQASLYTTSQKEAAGAATNFRFTEDHGVAFKAGSTSATDLVEVRRLYNSRTADFTWAPVGREVDALVAQGYADRGTAFRASPVSLGCTVAAVRYVRGAMHRFAETDDDKAALAKAGWTAERTLFHVVPTVPVATTPPPEPTPPTPAYGKFTLAVYPDTQQETGTDSRFVDRSKWVVANRDALNVAFVDHTGDVVNWDTADHAQYAVARQAMAPLEAAKIPYSLSIGNHDTQATGVGGAARDPKNTRALQRDTRVFNDYFTTAREGAVAGQFEDGKLDNTYSTFVAGGEKWLVLNLELWPRFAAVEWARNVVATHPDHNVVVSSHNLVEADGDIAGTSSAKSYQYGDASPRYVYDNLVLAYPNVRLTLSGHVGSTASRTDTGKAGNTVVSLLTTLHSNTDNPLRLVQVDTATNTITTNVFGVKTGATYEASNTFDAMAFVGGPAGGSAARR